MSFGGGFFGGGEKRTTLTTTTDTLTQAQDQRVQVGGSAGTVISPGAGVSEAGGGVALASPYSTVTQTITSSGVQSHEVQTLLDSVFANEGQSRATLADVAVSLSSGVQATNTQLSDLLAATKAPEQTALSSLLPVLILLVIVLMFWGK